jgi:LasA protease
LKRYLGWGLVLTSLVACTRPAPPSPQAGGLHTPAPLVLATAIPPTLAVTLISPTLDPSRTPAPDLSELYLVQPGDTLGQIAWQYDTTIQDLVTLNGLRDVDELHVGQALIVPIHVERSGPAFKLIPDSELVYGPAYAHFDLAQFVAGQNGYLQSYTHVVDGQTLSGVELVEWVAQHYSVGPRVLLALIEYQAGWVTQTTLDAQALAYPAGYVNPAYQGLLNQLTWAADHLNDGYYGWSERGYTTVRLGDGSRARLAPGLNAGTAGVQHTLALASSYEHWQNAVGPQGFYHAYLALFGDPFAYGVEPLLPAGITQPELRLPWPAGETWYYTGGPHGGWGSGSAWAAIDFTPFGDQTGCYDSDAWVTSASSGIVARSGDGMVVVDLDGDGLEHTGWNVIYLHIATHARVEAGVTLAAGDRIGHPSCEGGYSNGTHVHIARRFNGQWLAADGPLPLVLSGWQAQATLQEYAGTLVRDNRQVEACECREAKNGLVAD